jgi:glutathione S-transferase
MTLTFYTNPMSRGRIARWMLEEVDAEYETVVLDYAGAMKAPAYLAINPMGKVPAIVHDGHVVTEGAAICAYLADTYSEMGLTPTAAERADYYRWLFFAAGPVEAAVTNKALGFDVPADRGAMAGYGSYDLTVDTLERAVAAHEWIAGDRFTAADVYVGAQVMWGLQFQSLPTRPAFEAYGERLGARDAYKRATAKDDALMPAQG